jgi:hypothetical protein
VTAPTIAALDVAAARAATDRLRLTLTDAHEQLIELFRMRAHEALNYGPRLAGWTAYLAAEFGELLSVVPSPEQLAAMVDAGMSQREAAAPFRVSVGTVNAAVRSVRAAGTGLGAPDVHTSPGGGPAAPRRVSTVDRITALLAGQPGGLTVLEVGKRLRLRQAQAGPALCRLAAAGRITYLAPARRGQTGRYVVDGGAL